MIYATTKHSNHVDIISGLPGPRGGRQVGGEMSAPRVSDVDLAILLKASYLNPLESDLATDLKDARAQLQSQQEMRALYNKEPE